MPSDTTILIVDDDAVMRQMLERALARLGFRVAAYDGGEAGLRAVAEHSGNCLLVLDYAMPGMNGVEVCRRLRAHDDPEVSQTPVILLTAYSGEHHEIEALEAGADDFVSKPVNMTVLRARIETHMRVSALRRQLQTQNRELEEWRGLVECDMEAARLVQQALLPRQLPLCAGWHFATHWQSLIQVGGDIYDAMRMPDGRLLFWCADATGHGAAAALLTTFTKLLFRYAVDAGGPAEILRHINHDFRAIFKGASLLTAACVVLEPENGRVRVAGAGHPPLVVLRRDGRVEPVESTAPPIGLSLQPGLPEEVEVVVEETEALLFFSDGLYSAVGADGERLAFPEFLKRLEGIRLTNAEDLLKEVLERSNPGGAGEYDDDLTLLVLQCGKDYVTSGSPAGVAEAQRAASNAL